MFSRLWRPGKNKRISDMFPDLSLVVKIVPEPTVVVAVLATIRFTLEIVITRCTFLVAIRLAAMLDHFLDPPLFSVESRVHALIAFLPDIVDTGRNMIALSL